MGTRLEAEIASFSPVKKLLQKLGSWSTRVASGTTVEDAPSGFRAWRRSCRRGGMGMRVLSVPVGVVV